MIYKYGMSITGSLHVLENTVCQDGHGVFVDKYNSFAVGAVADGLGSSQHSDFASRTAVETAVEFCSERIGASSDSKLILDTIRAAFHLAQDTIEIAAENHGFEISDCDTTLSLCVFVNGSLYYGQSGDSGIIALSESGRYTNITTQQRDDNGQVFPLYCREKKWVFGEAVGKFAAVLLATDGIYETFFPIYIRDMPSEAIQSDETGVHVALLQYFMDIEQLQIKTLSEVAVLNERRAFVESIPSSTIDDDKTVLVILNDGVQAARQSPEYYGEPDWEKLREEWHENYRREAYPGLFDEPILNTSAEQAETQGDLP